MSAAHHLSSQFDDEDEDGDGLLYHGSGANPISGGVVKPTKTPYGFGAYTVKGYREHAEAFAAGAAARQNALFGTVYEVSPMSSLEKTGEDHDPFYRDPEGLKVLRAVSHPINYDLYRPELTTDSGKVIRPAEHWWEPKAPVALRRTFNLPVGPPED